MKCAVCEEARRILPAVAEEFDCNYAEYDMATAAGLAEAAFLDLLDSPLTLPIVAMLEPAKEPHEAVRAWWRGVVPGRMLIEHATWPNEEDTRKTWEIEDGPETGEGIAEDGRVPREERPRDGHSDPAV